MPDESPAYMDNVKDLVIRNIKRFSASRKKNEIRRYVDENMIMGTEFPLGLPISVLDLICEGIQHFTKKRIAFPSES
jgi:hypothetical protein